MFLSSSLKCLTAGLCGDLELQLLGSLHVQQLTNLHRLELVNCSRLVSLPSAEVFSRSLTSIELNGCENLSSLGGLGSLPSLLALEIRRCGKLMEVGLSRTPHPSGGEEVCPVDFDSKTSLRICWLKIDVPSLLLVELIKSLCHTEHLRIDDASEMESLLADRWLLQNRQSLEELFIMRVGSLELLPPNMRDISSLRCLHLYDATQLRSLPHLPSCLHDLKLSGVGQLNSLPDLPNSLKKLDLSGANQLRSLPDLPSCLEELELSDVGQLNSFPDLPSSLRKICIWNCDSDLEKKFAKLRSSERNKISHILRVRIDLEKKFAKCRSPERNKISHILRVCIGNLCFVMGRVCYGEIKQSLMYARDEEISSWLNESKHDLKIGLSSGWFSKHLCL